MKNSFQKLKAICLFAHNFRSKYLVISILFFSSQLLLSCNLFKSIDEPEGDPQILAAARACFDNGDFDCALNEYAKLANGSNDIKLSEEAFLLITRLGLGMGDFYSAFGQGGDGRSLTRLANGLSDPSATRRGFFFEAYKKGDRIGNTNLKGLVYFVASIAIAANVIAEGRGSGDFDYFPDLVASTSCYGTSNCIIEAGCNVGTGITSTGTTISFSSESVAGIQAGPPTLNHLKGAFAAATEALNLLQVSGRFSTGALSFTNTISSLTLTSGVAAEERCFRYFLIDQGVGR